MVDARPGLPGVVTDADGNPLPVYRGDPFAQVFQFVGQDTTDWLVNAQVRKRPDGEELLASFDVETAFTGDPELVRISLDEDASALLPTRCLAWDLERRTAVDEPRRTMLKGELDVDPDVTRVEEGS